MTHHIRRRAGAAALLLLLGTGVAEARSPFYLATFNQAALARQFALPATGPGAAASGGRLNLDWTSENVLEQSATEGLRLDGETLRLALGARGQWAGLELGIELPLLMTGGGVLDATIEHWHDWFGLPNGGRELVPRNDYRYQYVRNGVTVFDVTDHGQSLGDVRLDVADCHTSAGCWRAMLQLPTADADRLLGGGTGLALWYEQAYALDSAGRWSGVVGLGGSANRAVGPLSDEQRQWIPFGWLSLGYALTRSLDLGAQFYGHGALYRHSDLDAIRRPGGQLVFGFGYRADALRWRFGFQEDVITDSSPDFVIHLDADWG